MVEWLFLYTDVSESAVEKDGGLLWSAGNLSIHWGHVLIQSGDRRWNVGTTLWSRNEESLHEIMSHLFSKVQEVQEPANNRDNAQMNFYRIRESRMTLWPMSKRVHNMSCILRLHFSFSCIVCSFSRENLTLNAYLSAFSSRHFHLSIFLAELLHFSWLRF